jgi:uncharacterized protein YceH (UPF0502 family)
MRRNLTPLEARIVAVLVEKEATVRDSYPLSLNALCAGCNQKTAREPVMSLSDAEVLAAIEELKGLSLVNEVSGTRVVRYEHNLARVLGVPGAAAALLTLLVLRGPQTAAELRLHCERLHRFADVSSVEGFLDELAEKTPPRVRKLPRSPGARESRWAHLLCGDAGLEALSADAVSSGAVVDAGLAEEVAVLRAEVAELRGQLGRLAAALGADLE